MNSSNDWIILLGKRDVPTDGVRDYCDHLGRALTRQDCHLQLKEVPWAAIGWLRALYLLWQESIGWKNRWVILQYTAYGWSKRGFPLGFLAMMQILKYRQVRMAVVFHDPQGHAGQKFRYRLRRAFQEWAMRKAYHWAEKSVVMVPSNRTSWLPQNSSKTALIPVGSNVPEPAQVRNGKQTAESIKTVAVFGITGSPNMYSEVQDIAHALKRAMKEVPKLRLVVMGRGSSEAEELLEQALQGTGIRLSVLGLLPAETVSQTIAASDVLLFVRGAIHAGRTSAIAGIACGVPVVSYAGPLTAVPITDAGVLFAPLGDSDALAQALTRVLTDPLLWNELHLRNISAHRRYFSWEVIAGQFLKGLAER